MNEVEVLGVDGNALEDCRDAADDDERVARLMQENGIWARVLRRFRHTTDSRHRLPAAPNLLTQNFTATAPNQVWVGDITYIWTAEGWSYLAVLLDLYSPRVVGWAMRKFAQLRAGTRRARPCPDMPPATFRSLPPHRPRQSIREQSVSARAGTPRRGR